MEKCSNQGKHNNNVTESTAIRDSNEKVHKSLVSLIDGKDKVISQQEAVIKSLKGTIETNKATLAHKDEVMSEQVATIISLKTEFNTTDHNVAIKHAEENLAMEAKRNEIKNYQSQLQHVNKDNLKLTDEIGSLRR